jgi:hypothetical protein
MGKGGPATPALTLGFGLAYSGKFGTLSRHFS